jgi:hypothetical protein
MKYFAFALIATTCSAPLYAQVVDGSVAAANTAGPGPVRTVNQAGQWMQGKLMPANTMLTVTPMQDISSKHIEVGQTYRFVTVGDVVENGATVIPRGSPVAGVITYKTGRAIGGKSGKFDVEFRTVLVNGKEVPLTGKHHQEGRGNTVGALLGSILISGRSAVMIQGQQATAFTAGPVPY